MNEDQWFQRGIRDRIIGTSERRSIDALMPCCLDALMPFFSDLRSLIPDHRNDCNSLIIIVHNSE